VPYDNEKNEPEEERVDTEVLRSKAKARTLKNKKGRFNFKSR